MSFLSSLTSIEKWSLERSNNGPAVTSSSLEYLIVPTDAKAIGSVNSHGDRPGSRARGAVRGRSHSPPPQLISSGGVQVADNIALQAQADIVNDLSDISSSAPAGGSQLIDRLKRLSMQLQQPTGSVSTSGNAESNGGIRGRFNFRSRAGGPESRTGVASKALLVSGPDTPVIGDCCIWANVSEVNNCC